MVVDTFWNFMEKFISESSVRLGKRSSDFLFFPREAQCRISGWFGECNPHTCYTHSRAFLYSQGCFTFFWLSPTSHLKLFVLSKLAWPQNNVFILYKKKMICIDETPRCKRGRGCTFLKEVRLKSFCFKEQCLKQNKSANCQNHSILNLEKCFNNI